MTYGLKIFVMFVLGMILITSPLTLEASTSTVIIYTCLDINNDSGCGMDEQGVSTIVHIFGSGASLVAPTDTNGYAKFQMDEGIYTVEVGDIQKIIEVGETGGSTSVDLPIPAIHTYLPLVFSFSLFGTRLPGRGLASVRQRYHL